MRFRKRFLKMKNPCPLTKKIRHEKDKHTSSGRKEMFDEEVC